MQSHSTAGRGLAILAGAAFVGGALYVMLEDAIKSGNWTTTHLLMPVIVGGTIASGHLVWRALSERKPISAAGLALVFLAGTALTVFASVGRQAETADSKVATVTSANDVIAERKAERSKAVKRLDQANTMAEQEMTGQKCGVRCGDWKTRAREVEARIKQLDAEIKSLGVAKPAAPEADRIARAASYFGADFEKAKAAVFVFQPFALSLFLELGAIIMLGYGLSPAAGQQPVPARVAAPASLAITEESRDITDAEIEQLRKLLLATRGPMTNQEIADRLEVSKGEASKRISKLVSAGYASRERVGRNVAVSLH